MEEIWLQIAPHRRCIGDAARYCDSIYSDPIWEALSAGGGLAVGLEYQRSLGAAGNLPLVPDGCRPDVRLGGGLHRVSVGARGLDARSAAPGWLAGLGTSSD